MNCVNIKILKFTINIDKLQLMHPSVSGNTHYDYTMKYDVLDPKNKTTRQINFVFSLKFPYGYIDLSGSCFLIGNQKQLQFVFTHDSIDREYIYNVINYVISRHSLLRTNIICKKDNITIPIKNLLHALDDTIDRTGITFESNGMSLVNDKSITQEHKNILQERQKFAQFVDYLIKDTLIIIEKKYNLNDFIKNYIIFNKNIKLSTTDLKGKPIHITLIYSKQQIIGNIQKRLMKCFPKDLKKLDLIYLEFENTYLPILLHI